jgi:hypothetical protein
MKTDLQSVIKPMYCFTAAAGTTGTGMKGTVIDRKGYNGVEFLVQYGAWTSTTGTVTIRVEECDNSTTGNFTSVADADLLGTEALAGLPAATRTDGVGDKVCKRIGYIGKKRYVRILEVPTGTAAAVLSATCILHTPEVAPVSNP